MDDIRCELEAALRKRGALAPSERLIAAWRGRSIGAPAGPAVLGVTPTELHLLSGSGLVHLDLRTIRAGAPGRRRLEVSGANADGTRFTVSLDIDMPVAVASQLNDMRRTSTDVLAAAGTSGAPRPPAKRRGGSCAPDRGSTVVRPISDNGRMCGRYVSVRSDDDLSTEFDAVDATEGEWPEPDWNVAPTKPVRAIVNRPLRDENGTAAKTPTRQLRVMSWGLVPSWSRDRKTQGRMFNARAEGVASTNAFRKAYAKRRCLVPADGWYEWRRIDGPDGVTKQAMYMTPADGHSLAFAGLYEFWRDPADKDATTLTTCTIITAPSSGELGSIHDRMPLVLPRAGWARWLDPAVDDPSDLLRPWDEAVGEHLELRPVADRVNKVDNNGPDLVVEVEPVPESQTLF